MTHQRFPAVLSVGCDVDFDPAAAASRRACSSTSMISGTPIGIAVGSTSRRQIAPQAHQQPHEQQRERADTIIFDGHSRSLGVDRGIAGRVGAHGVVQL